MRVKPILAMLAGASLLASTAIAGPYAGIVRTSSQAVAEGAGLDVSYYLPIAADTVSIEVLDSGSSTVATFAGTANAGLNTVTWDGSVDNAGGADVPTGSDYTLKITVNLAAAPGWSVVKSNGSGSGTLFSGFSGTHINLQWDQDSDLFGYVLPNSSFNSVAAVIVLTSDLEPETGDGQASRVNKSPSELAAPVGNGAIWGSDFVPGTDNLFFVGQLGPSEHYYADNSSGLADSSSSALNGHTLATVPRNVTLVDEGGQNYGYMTAGNSSIYKFPVDAAGLATGDSFDILNLTDTGLYSKGVTTDAAGNLYWSSRSGYVYRWDAADVQAIDDDTDPKLTEADASWVIDFTGATNSTVNGTTITPSGAVYTIATDGTTESDTSIYFVGNVTTATLAKSVVDGDEILAAPGNICDGVYGSIHSDAFGNLYTHNRSPETISMLTPGGTTSHVTVSPASQAFSIGSSVSDWSMY